MHSDMRPVQGSGRHTGQIPAECREGVLQLAQVPVNYLSDFSPAICPRCLPPQLPRAPGHPVSDVAHGSPRRRHWRRNIWGMSPRPRDRWTDAHWRRGLSASLINGSRFSFEGKMASRGGFCIRSPVTLSGRAAPVPSPCSGRGDDGMADWNLLTRAQMNVEVLAAYFALTNRISGKRTGM